MGAKFKSNIPQMENNLEELGSTGLQLSFDEVFNPGFLAECSSFTSVVDMFEKSGFCVKAQEDFAAIPDEEWEHFITGNTTYASWKEMQEAAHLAANKLIQQKFHEHLTRNFKKL